MLAGEAKNILCYSFSGIGDVISTLHVVRSLADSGHCVYYATHSELLDLFNTQSFIKPISLSQIGSQKFDWLIDFESSSLSKKNIKKINAQKKVGLCKGLDRRIKNLFYYDAQLPKETTGNIVRDYDVFFDFFGLKKYQEPVLDNNVLLNCYKTKNKKTIGLHATARNSLRVLPESLVLSFCNEAEMKGYSVVFFGSEFDQIEAFLAKTKNTTWFKGSLLETANQLLELDFFVGTDSGILHLNSALGKRGVGLYGPKRAYQVIPSTNIYPLEVEYPCRPCDQNKPCLFQKRCLTSIQTKDIWAIIERFKDV